jgi:hypothetical protein
LFLAACGPRGTAITPPTAAPATIARPTATTLPTATHTAEPTATPAPSTTSTSAASVTPSASATAGGSEIGITITGSDEFAAQTEAALVFLQECDPAALTTADELLVYIVEAERSGALVEDGGFAASESTAFAPGYSNPAQVYWYAGAIIHDARHRWQSLNGMTTNWDALSLEEREEIEADARAVQIAALDRCAPVVPASARYETDYMLKYLTDMQAGITPCDYCEVEWADRDW